MICYLFTEPIYFLFSADVPGLLYYSHIPTAIIAILIGFLVFWNGKKLLLNRLLFGISVCFSLWVLSNLILWTNIHSDLMLFVWSFLRIFSSLMSILCIYFMYVFLEKRDISFLLKGIFLVLLIPVIILAPTYVNVGGFDLVNCDAFMFEGSLFQILRVLFGVLAMIWIFILIVRRYRIAEANFKRQILLMGVGIELFLFSFFLVTFLAAYFTNIGILADSRLEYYGLFGMVVFVIYLSILIVRFRAFNVKLLATQALVFGLTILIGSQFFFIESNTNLILNGITFVGIIVLGAYLIKSVKKEVDQREKLEVLTGQLKDANEKLKSLDLLKTEFVSLASHQLRSPLTAIKGYTSMILEGDYGEVSPKIKEVVDKIMESSNNLALFVEDLLDVSKIEQGGMKYEMIKFDFNEMVKETVNELSIVAEKKGLKLKYYIPSDRKYVVSGDKEKLRQIIINLVDNSMKYTKQGGINVLLKSENKVLTLSIKDTGIGVPPEVASKLFQKFSRGSDGAKVNTSGSGLGLYIVREIIEAHKGKVWVESEGVGKGSTFFVQINEA